MAKDPARRYVSVDQFSADLRRYLEGLPVRARKDTVPYRASKFVRRNKFGVAVAALVALTLLGGIIGTTAQRNRAERLRLRAEKGEANNRQLLYAAQMSLAYQAWETANVGRTLDLLEAQRPAEGRRFARLRMVPPLAANPRKIAGFAWANRARSLGHFFPRWSSDRRGERRWEGVCLGRRDGRAAPIFRGRLLAREDGLYSRRKLLVTGCADGSAKLWTVEGDRLVRTFNGHKDAVWCIALSPDGRTLATASLDATTKLWNLETGEELLTLRGHADAVTSVAFSPDGRTIATSSRDHTAKLWDASTGKEIATLVGHTWWVLDLAFSPDGKTLATTGSDGDVRLWDVSQQRETGIIRGDGSTIDSLGFA